MAKTKTPNYELLRDAYAIIDGIPNQNFDLNRWYREDGCPLSEAVKKGKIGECGTIACAGGWLAQHPMFNELGLKITRPRHYQEKGFEATSYWGGENDRLGDKQIYFRGNRAWNMEALAGAFGITEEDAENLFNTVGSSKYDREITKLKTGVDVANVGYYDSDDYHGKVRGQTRFKLRVKMFLKEKGQPVGRIR